MPGKTPVDSSLALSSGVRILEGNTTRADIAALFADLKGRLTATVRQNSVRRSYASSAAVPVKWSLWVGRFDRSPAWIRGSILLDRLWGYALIMECNGFIGISASRVGDIAAQLAVPTVGWDALASFEVTDDSNMLNVTLRSTKASANGAQTRQVAGERLERTMSRLQIGHQIATRYKFRENASTWNISPGTGGVTQQGPRLTLGELCDWFAEQTAALLSGGSSSAFIDGFAKRRHISLVGSKLQPIALQLDVSQLSDELDEGGTLSRNGVPLSGAQLDRVLTRLRKLRALTPNGAGGWDATSKGAAFIEVRVLKKRLSLHSTYLSRLSLEDHEGEKRSLLRLFSDKGYYLVTFDEPAFAYHMGELFEDSGVAEGSGALTEILVPALTSPLTSEKGNNGTVFDSTSLFGWIEANSKGRLVCDDMGSEWADYIGIGSAKRTVSLYHAKFSSKSGVRASGLHEVISQAVKNLGLATAPASEFAQRGPRWQQNWNGTLIQRARRGTVPQILAAYRQARASPLFRMEVVLVTTALSKKAVEKAFAKIRSGKLPGGHGSQLMWLLSMFVDQCRELNAVPRIICCP